MKKIIKTILTFLLSVSVFLPNVAQTVKALGTLSNVKISSDGIATWDAYPGADSYYYTYASWGGYVEEETLNLKELNVKSGDKTGDYMLKLTAYSGSTKISETYDEGIYHYVAKGTLSNPQNLRWDGNVARWNAVTNADDYHFYLYDETNRQIIYSFTTDSGTSADLTGSGFIKDGVQYYFTVKAVSESGYANSEEATSPKTYLNGITLGKITNLEISPAGIVTWDDYEGADTYTFHIGSGGGYCKSPYDLHDTVTKFGFSVGMYYDCYIVAQKEDHLFNTTRYTEITEKEYFDFYYNELITITLDNNGVDGTVYEPVKAIKYTEYKDIISYYGLSPKADGYVFEGWYHDKACTDPVESNDGPSGNETLYAKWDTAINEVNLNLDKYPEWPGSLDVTGYNLTEESGANYTIYSYGWYKYNGTEFVEALGSLENATTYYLGVELGAKEDYLFDYEWDNSQLNVTFNLNGRIVYPEIKYRYVRELYVYIPLFSSHADGSIYISVNVKDSEGGFVGINTETPFGSNDTKHVMPGEPITITARPDEGCTFKEWRDTTYNGEEFISNESVITFSALHDSYITAVFEKAKQVSFDTDGGSSVESQFVSVGGYATRPSEDPVKEGYLFDNWYTDNTYSTKFDFEHTEITRDTVIYGRFLEILKVVEATITEPVDGELQDQNPVGADDSKYEVIFENWYLNRSPDYPTLKVDEPFEGGQTYTVRMQFHVKDGYVITNETVMKINGITAGCYGDPWCGEVEFEVAKLHTVTFVTNGDTPDFTVKVKDGEKVSCPADPVREGYQFAGWCGDPECTTAYEFSTIINNDIYVYGSWQELFTVEFESNDGSAVESKKVVDGDAVDKPEDPMRENYVFKGWFYYGADGDLHEYNFESAVKGNLVLYAQWELIPVEERDYYLIEFELNGGSGEKPAAIKIEKGKEYTLPECMFTPFPESEFACWDIISTKENAVIQSDVKPGEKITVNEDITIMPMWQQFTIRLAGANRYETAIKAAEEMKARLGVEKFNVVILTTGDNFADALSGGFLAARNDAPILLTRERSYETVNNYIKNNLADGGKVYVLGGVQAVPEKCLKGLEGFTIKRIAGANRYETNLKILDEADAKHFAVQVCTGNNFADSLSASATGLPIILVKDELSDTQKNYLKTLGTEQFYVIGGKAAVSDKVIDQLKKLGSVKRVAGNNRYETSVEIAKEFFGTHVDRVVLAYAKNFPDGLAGGPLGFEYNAPVILTMTGHEAEAVRYCKDAYPDAAVVMGGSSLISDTAVRKILDMKSSDKIIEK